MGYYSRVSGEIDIEPAIPARLLATSPFMNWPQGARTAVRFHVEETTTEVEDGTLTERLVTSIVPIQTDLDKAHLLKDLREAVKSIYFAGSTCDGVLVRVGEEPGDVERYIVKDDGVAVVVEKARMTWPDGTKVVL